MVKCLIYSLSGKSVPFKELDIYPCRMHWHISGFVIVLHNRVGIPHWFLFTKVNLQKGYGQNKSVHPDVHWSDTTQWQWDRVGCEEGDRLEKCAVERERRADIQDVFTLHLTASTLTTLHKSINILYHLTCMKWFLHVQKTTGTVFSAYCLLHKCLATVEIVLYFPCALAPFHIFENSTFGVCVKQSSLVV